ncbi:fumarylacetoacetate hydrolase family protein [Parasphingorhabdus pacifica]
MKVLRYLNGTQPVTGCVLDGQIHHVADVPRVADLVAGEGAGSVMPEELLAPVLPGTVFGMAHNTGPSDRELPPAAFLKAVASVAGPGESIPLPDGIGRVDAEAELCAVLSEPLRNAGPGDVPSALLGYTVGLDVTGRDAQQYDPLWTEAKSRSGFTPIGPWIETDLNADDARIRLWHNGEEVATGTTAGLARGPFEAISYVSTLVELRPGDVVLTGAPNTSATVRPGDVVAAEIEGIGVLSCPVVRSSDG